MPWETRVNELIKYKAKHGDCDVPVRQGKLGMWVSNQRQCYMADSLSQDRIDRLSGIGFKWALKVKGPEVPWETRFDQLVQYKANHGDCNIPTTQGQLGTWVSTQRANYRKGKLSQDRITCLDGIDFDWPRPRGSSRIDSKVVPWETRFDELVQYKAEHGDCNVPRSQGQLGWWAVTQRQSYRKGKLSQERINRLNGMGFDWTPGRVGSRKRKAPPSTRKLSRKERVSPTGTTANALSVGDGERGGESNGSKEGCNATSVLSLKVPPKRPLHNSGRESDDEVDEIGALIYEQVMRRRQSSRLLKSDDVPIKTEEMMKYSCETYRDDDSTS